MNPLEYLESLIAGQHISNIPVQLSELELLRIFILQEQAAQQKK
jgi:hypothetical protein